MGRWGGGRSTECRVLSTEGDLRQRVRGRVRDRGRNGRVDPLISWPGERQAKCAECWVECGIEYRVLGRGGYGDTWTSGDAGPCLNAVLPLPERLFHTEFDGGVVQVNDTTGVVGADAMPADDLDPKR